MQASRERLRIVRHRKLAHVTQGPVAASALLIVATWFMTRSATASPQFDIAPECGSGAEFLREVEVRWGHPVSLSDTSIAISRDSSGYRLVVRMGRERRELADADCRQLFQTAVVVTLAMMQPETAAPSSDTPSTLAQPTETDRAATPPNSELVRRVDTSPEPRAGSAVGAHGQPVGFELGVSAGVNAGLLPRPALALGVDARILRGAWGASLAVRYLSLSARQDPQGRGVEVRALGADVAALYQPRPTLELHLGVSADLLMGAGLGPPTTRSDSAWALGPNAGISVYPVRRRSIWVGLGAEAELDVFRPRFEILHYQADVFRVPLWSGSAFLRVAHRFF